MSEAVNLTIDGNNVKVPAGTTILDAAEAAGVHIPNLCYLKGLKGIGACRLCMVEIEGLKAPMTACTLKVKDGMVVNTQTEKINDIRKNVIDLIVSMHPLDCMTCTKAGGCNLQTYAYDFEIKESSFSRKKLGFPIDEANPFIKRDPDYCVLCSRCVRVCKEQGTAVLDFSGRGVGSKVVTADDGPLQDAGCTFCGSCVDACPVNALLEADRWRKGREWEYSKVRSVCTSCGNGCDITVSVYEGEIAKINAGSESGLAEHYICAVGRFGFDALNADTRVTSPMIKDGDEMKEVSLKDALKEASKKLKGTSSGIIASGSLLNEDALTLAAFAKEAKIKNITSTASVYSDKDSLVGEEVDIEAADLVVLAGIDPSQWKRTLPALDAIIRKKVSRGAKLIVLNSDDVSVSGVANAYIKSDEAKSLKALAKALADSGLKAPKGMDLKGAKVSEALKEAAEIYAKAENPIVISSPSLYGAAVNVALMKGSAVSVPLDANAKGTIAMGIDPDPKKYSDMLSGNVKVLYVVGDMPFHERPDVDFLIVQTSHMTELAKQADIVLPAADPLESEGSVIDYLGRFKEVRQAVAPVGDVLQHRDIIAGIAKEKGLSVKPSKVSDTKKLSKAKVKLAIGEFKKKEGMDADLEEYMRSVNKPVITGSRLLWLKEIEKTVAV
jgi:NADH dehydrogenase/NADH:ubiquinone oxidoreductase subunit G